MSSTGVPGIQDSDQHLYSHLHLNGGVFVYYDQLPPATQEDHDAAPSHV